MKQTAIEWLIDELRKLSHNKNNHLGMGDIRITQGMLDDLFEQAKEMEKQQSQKYAEFAIHCDRNNLPILKFEDFIKL